MKTRREVLSYFGVGAVIVPIIGGVAEQAATAKLIEVPKVEIIPAESISRTGTPLDMHQVKSVTVIFENQDGSRRSMQSWRTHELDGSVKPGQSIRLDIRMLRAHESSPESYAREASILASAALL